MIRLIWRFAILAGLAALFTWLADSPGNVTVVWRKLPETLRERMPGPFSLRAILAASPPAIYGNG